MRQEIEAVSIETYQKYHEEAADIIAIICAVQHTNRANINDRDVINYFINQYSITFIAFTRGMATNLHQTAIKFDSCQVVDPILSEKTDGFTSKMPGEHYFVYVNVDKPASRILYTVTHELIHIMLHLEDPTTAAVFKDHDLFEPYTEEQKKYEREAGYVAGMLLLNDDQLQIQINHFGRSFSALARVYGLSYKALHNRIFGWLAYTMQYNKALGVLLDYRSGNQQQIQWVINAWQEYCANAAQG